jgi:indolepyruvate ferredoxin oxidoreductase
MTDLVAMRSDRVAMTDLESKYTLAEGQVFMTGIQALVRLLLEQMRRDQAAGLRTRGFVSGYPGSPLGGIDKELISRRALLAEAGIVHQSGLNEELAATAVMGSQNLQAVGTPLVDGVLGAWYGKTPGLDRASDAIRLGAFAGTTRHGGTLVMVGDDPAAKSSSLPYSSEHELADLNIPVLYPGNPQEVLDFGLHAIALSRASGLWAALKIVSAVADGSGTVELDPNRVRPNVPLGDDGRPIGPDAVQSLSPLTLMAGEREINERRLLLAERYSIDNQLNRVTVDAPDAWLGIVASGHTYHEVGSALAQLGLDHAALARFGVRVFHVAMLHPLEPSAVRAFAVGLEEIMVIEEKRPFLEDRLRTILYGTANAPRIVGKRNPDGGVLVPSFGALDADKIRQPLRARLTQRIADTQLTPEPQRRERKMLPIIPRTPYFCSGCPHNTSLRVPEGAQVGAGIGCHSMVAFMDDDIAGHITGVTQMGGEGAQWIGQAPFVDTEHIFQNLGDGTYFHSGQLAVQAAIASGAKITYKLLYNKAVAMTGGQDVTGALEVVDVANILLRQGVKKVIVTTDDRSRYKGVRLPDGAELWGRSRIIEAQERLREHDGVTVLIHDQQCAAEARRLRKRGQQSTPKDLILINQRVCEGCGDCGAKSNCLSVQPIDTEFGRKTVIEQTSCNRDYSCLQGDCPSFVTITPIEPSKWKFWQRSTPQGASNSRRKPPTIELGDLSEPEVTVAAAEFNVRMPGIGGTGVVTIAQILGTAAQLDGMDVTGVDQTGLSQKGGAVVSDLVLSRERIEGGNKVGDGEVDLYLVFDLLVGVSPLNLAGASPERTVTVGSTAQVATGQVVSHVNLDPPDPLMLQQAIDEVSRADRNVYLDAPRLAKAIFGNATGANVLLLGVAYQSGLIPVSAASIERAIELNGAAVEMNLQAFRYGRLWVFDRARVEALVGPGHDAGAAAAATASDLLGPLADAGELGRVLAIRAADLIDYQDRKYAARYVDIVRKEAEREAAAVPGRTEFSEAVGRYLYKLMAYKDEYEVARLHLEAQAQAQIDELAAGRNVRVAWNLHPPILKAVGLDRKIQLGSWFTPAFKSLQAMRRVRGTKLDPFGYAHVRRVERSLIEEYVAAIERIASVLDENNYDAAVTLASLPDRVRGYEDVKLGNVERYREQLAQSLAALVEPARAVAASVEGA